MVVGADATTPTSATTYIVWFKPFDLTPNKELSRLLSFNHITHKVRTTNLITTTHQDEDDLLG